MFITDQLHPIVLGPNISVYMSWKEKDIKLEKECDALWEDRINNEYVLTIGSNEILRLDQSKITELYFKKENKNGTEN